MIEVKQFEDHVHLNSLGLFFEDEINNSFTNLLNIIIRNIQNVLFWSVFYIDLIIALI